MSGHQNDIPHADTPVSAISAVGSDRVQAPVANVGFTDCGGSQQSLNNPGGSDRLVPTEKNATSGTSGGAEPLKSQHLRRRNSESMALWNKRNEAIANEDKHVKLLSDAIFALQRVCRNRKNIGNEVKDYVDAAVLSLGELKRFRSLWNNKPPAVAKDSSSTQPSESNHGSSVDQTTKKRPLSSPNSHTQRPKRILSDSEWLIAGRHGKHRGGGGSALELNNSNSTKPTGKSEPAHRKTKRNKRRREAILINPAEGITYAELLRGVRTKVKPEDTGTLIKTIRESRSGGILVELEHNCKNRGAFSKAVKAAVGNSGTVRDLVPKATVEIRDLDDITTEEDIRAALSRDLGEHHEVNRVSLSKTSYRGQRSATVVLQEEGLSKLLDAGRIKVGWVSCRIREAIKVVRCFRCLDYGHLARACKGPDRSKLCLKCGEANHKIEACQKDARCLLCAALKDTAINSEHITGSRTCPRFREEYAKSVNSRK